MHTLAWLAAGVGNVICPVAQETHGIRHLRAPEPPHLISGHCKQDAATLNKRFDAAFQLHAAYG